MTDHTTPATNAREGCCSIDSEITYTLVGAILTGIGWMVKKLVASIKEARDGRKDEAQRIAAERDKGKLEIQRLKDELRQERLDRDAEVRELYKKKMRLREEIYKTRQVAINKGKLTVDDLPPLID